MKYFFRENKCLFRGQHTFVKQLCEIRGIFTNIFRFLKRGTLWEPRFPNATPTNPSRRFQTFPEFSSQCYGPYKTTFEILEILKIEILTIFFSFSLTFGPMRVEIQNATPTNRS